jgi:hypothetical protein
MFGGIDVAQALLPALMPAAPRLISALRRIQENSPAHDPLIHMRQFRRRLPHRHPEGKWLFVTRHLHGSLPQAMYPPPGKPSSGSAFVWMDRYLDSARSGPGYLAQEPIAHIVAASLRRGELLGQYELGAYAIMANHVHVLLLPKVAPSRLLAVAKRGDGAAGESTPGPHGRDVLASRVLRSLGCAMKRNGTELLPISRTTR